VGPNAWNEGIPIILLLVDPFVIILLKNVQRTVKLSSWDNLFNAPIISFSSDNPH
jgi:hypothetical protein